MNKAILVSIIAVFAVLTLAFVSASTGDLTEDWRVTINGVEDVVDGDTIAVTAGDTLPITLVFRSLEDCENDVIVQAEIGGYRTDIEDQTNRFSVLSNGVYTKRLTLQIPSDIKLAEDYTLTLTVRNKDKKDFQDFSLRFERESYKLEVLDASLPSQAQAGSVVAMDVVLKNWGMNSLEDVFVKVTIPEIGVSQNVYFGDIDALDECETGFPDEICNDTSCATIFKDCNSEDAMERRVYIAIPENAKSGTYNVELEAANADESIVVKKTIVISGKESATTILTGSATKTVSRGQEITYDLVIVNSGSSMKVYTMAPEQTQGLTIDTEPIVTVPADSSRTVKVKVKATDTAQEGTHVIKMDVLSDGQTVKQVILTANVQRSGQGAVTNSVVVLTIILVIIFVVLLIILIVLLTKRPASMETEETSYY